MRTKLIFFILFGSSWLLLSTSISSCKTEKGKGAPQAVGSSELVISEFMCFNKKTIKDGLNKSSEPNQGYTFFRGV